MITVFVRKLFLILTCVLYTTAAFAQAPQQKEEPSLTAAPKRQFATILYVGLGGAVLGLSTLSFYTRPQDHLSNIATGFGLGIIIGAIYTTYNAATNPKDFYSQEFSTNSLELSLAKSRELMPEKALQRWDVRLLEYTF